MYILFQDFIKYVYCYECNRIFKGDDVNVILRQHPQHNGQSGIEFPGVVVKPEFISESERTDLMTGIDELPWDISQSGRRKQVCTEV